MYMYCIHTCTCTCISWARSTFRRSVEYLCTTHIHAAAQVWTHHHVSHQSSFDAVGCCTIYHAHDLRELGEAEALLVDVELDVVLAHEDVAEDP